MSNRVDWSVLDDDLKALYARGFSFGEIARMLGEKHGVRVSRNACIGRKDRLLKNPLSRVAHRAKASAPGQASSGVVAALPRVAGSVSKSVNPLSAPEALSLRVSSAALNVGLEALRPGQCRWPTTGDGETQKFCGLPVAVMAGRRSSYCAGCADRGRRSATVRTDAQAKADAARGRRFWGAITG